MKKTQIFSRQTDRAILLILGISVLAAAPMLIVDRYKARNAEQESKRIGEVMAAVEQKLEAYHESTGYYPESMDVLTFSSSPKEIRMLPDLKKIRYRRTPSNYAIRWDCDDGHNR